VSARPKYRQKKQLPLPPYGQRVVDAIRRGENVNTFVIATRDPWNTHRRRLDKVILPANDDPALYDWSFLRGQEPTVIAGDSDQERIKQLLGLLLRARVSVVACIFYEGEQLYCRHFRP
jgi:hypothetical protein